MGFHIAPSVAYDEAGKAGPVRSLLDTPVSVPSGDADALRNTSMRSSSDISTATGIPIRDLGWSLDPRYAANGYMLRSNFPSEADREYRLFRWGASEMLAREALEDLLSGSATTMTWFLTCAPDAGAQNRQACSLGAEPAGRGR